MARTDRKSLANIPKIIVHKEVGAVVHVTGFKIVTGKHPKSSGYKLLTVAEVKRAQELAAVLKGKNLIVGRYKKTRDVPQKVEETAVQPITTEGYVEGVLTALRARLVERFEQLADTDVEVPSPEHLADLISAGVPAAGPEDLDPHFADVGPFYDSAGAMLQLGGITKQALESRRANQTVLAMQVGNGQWLYPAWQFNGNGSIHPELVPVLKALRDLDRWIAGVWLVAEHPDLSNQSPRQALRAKVAADVVAHLAEHDKAAFVV